MTTPLRDRWRNGDTTLGGWLATPSSVMAEATARAGFDYVCVDTQHGAIEYSDAVGLIQAILLGGSSPIVRVPWNEPGIIGKMLDAGAHGVIVPMVNSVEEARAAVAAGRYAPHGTRSYGPSVAGLIAAKDKALDAEIAAKLDATVAAMAAMKARGETVEAYDQMIGEGNKEGNAAVQAAIDGLVDQALFGIVIIDLPGAAPVAQGRSIFEQIDDLWRSLGADTLG